MIIIEGEQRQEEIKMEKIEIVIKEIEELIESGFFKASLKGRKGLRSSVKKDAHPLLKYVHRMIQFYSGIDTCIPTTTQFYLQDFVDEVLNQKYGDNDRLTVWLLRDRIKNIYDILDNHAKELCLVFGLDKNRASKVWNKSFFG